MVTTVSEFQWNNTVWRGDRAAVHTVHFCWEISTSFFFLFPQLPNTALFLLIPKKRSFFFLTSLWMSGNIS